MSRFIAMLSAALSGSLLAVLAAVGSGTAVAATSSAITFEELLHAENFEGQEPMFSPDGRALAFSIQMGAASFPSWGYFSSFTRERVYVSIDGGTPREIPSPADIRYSLFPGQAWSPDSAGLMLLAARKEGYGLAYYDLASSRITPLSGVPLNYFAFAWDGHGRAVYTTAGEAGQQWHAGSQKLDHIIRRWRGAWESDTPQVTVSSSNPLFPGTAAEEGGLVLADLATGKTHKIGNGDFLTIVASPDGSFIAAVRVAEPAVNALHYPGQRCELQIFRLEREGAHLVRRYEALDISPLDGLAFSPSGDKLLAVGRPKNGSGTRLYEIDVVTGRSVELAGAALSFEKPRPERSSLPIGWVEGKPAAIASRYVSGQSGGSDRGAGCAAEYGQCRDLRFDLFVFNGEGRQNLTEFSTSSVSSFIATDDGNAVVVADSGLWKVSPSGKNEKRLTAPDASITGFGVDKRYPRLPTSTAYYRDGNTERVSLTATADGKPMRSVFDLKHGVLSVLEAPGEIAATAPDQATVLDRTEDGWSSSYVLNRNGGGNVLANINGGLKDKAIGHYERFTYRVSDRELSGWVLWPPVTTPGTKLPAVVSVYGGVVYGEKPPGAGRVTANISLPVFSGQLLAAEGYAVIFPSAPLGPGAKEDQPKQLADSVVAAVDALAAKGGIDPDRVGVMGASYGGYSTAAILSRRSDRFKAGISLVGIYDFIQAWGKRSIVETLSDIPLGSDSAESIEEGQSLLQKPFWQTPEAYIRNSPIFDVEKLDAPLLMLHGDLDGGATGLDGAERMYTALLRAGKKPVLVHYWGEGHAPRSASAMRDHWKRITGWFGYYLRGEPSTSW